MKLETRSEVWTQTNLLNIRSTTTEMNVSTYHFFLVWWTFLFFLWKITLDNILLYQSKRPIYSNFSSFFTITNFVRHISKYFNESNDNKWQRKMKWKKRKTSNMGKKLLLIKNYRLERLTEETHEHLLAWKSKTKIAEYSYYIFFNINHKFHICRCYFDDWSFWTKLLFLLP